MKRVASLGLLALTSLVALTGASPPGPEDDPSPAAPRRDDPAAAPIERVANVLPSPHASDASALPSLQGSASPIHPLNLPSGAPKTGVSSQAISLPQGPGTIASPGQSFSAQLSSGLGSYAIPLNLPAARGKAQQGLTLAYSSMRSHGVAGVGWDLGVPFIARQTDRGLPAYQDPPAGGAWAPQQDRFVFNGGQELVPICLVAAGGSCQGAIPGEVMPAWAEGWQYFRAHVESGFERFFWSPDHRTWRVQDKSGVTIELGMPLDGSDRVDPLETDPASPARIFRWNAARIYDTDVEASPPAGVTARPVNVVAYRYMKSGEVAYLTDVYDTPPRKNAAGAPISEYAHHTRVIYEVRTDPLTSFRRGWRTDQTLRVRRIDVTSKPFSGTPSAPRELLRRYHLAYDGGYHPSLLESVTLEGRCSSPVTESGRGVLPATTGCPTLPPVSLGYQHVQPFKVNGQPGVADLPGFEGFDERVLHLQNSPGYSLDGKNADLFDVDADGLPDVLVTLPGFFQGKHGVFFNGANGQAGRFTADTIGVAGVLGANAGTLTLSNSSVSPQDLDGDGIIDLLHMPAVKTYAVYTPAKLASGWSWVGRAVTTAAAQSPKIDFTNHQADIRVMDVNGDGLVDVVYSAGAEIQTFFSLGRHQGGDGQFGHVTWTGAPAPVISNDPVSACVPWAGAPVALGDPDVRLADMNGDGLPDIVRVRKGQIRYWPGRGDGFWGTGDAATCPAGTFGQDRHVEMASSPFYSDPSGTPQLDDVNGDGLPDLVQVRFDAVDVWLNVDGVAWTPERHVIQGTPPLAALQNHVRLADANGSGTRDILWGDAGDYKYIDLLGGAMPWVLTRVDNGMGRTTDIEYTTSTAMMLADAAAGTPWRSRAPMSVHLVRRVTDRSNLDAFGRPGGAYTTEYWYRDPVYDGRRRELRGFRVAETRRLGDDNSPSSTTRSTFLLGECLDDDPGDAVDPCAVGEEWRDNPREALKGLVSRVETFNDAQVYASTTHTTYRLRRLYTGADGRQVRHAFLSSTDAFVYDTGASLSGLFVKAWVVLPDVEHELAAGSVVVEEGTKIPLRSMAGTAHLRAEARADFFGNATDNILHGCVDGCPTVDEIITTHAEPARPSGDPTGWLWRTVESYVTGSGQPAQKRKHTFTEYDDRGHALSSKAELTGTLPLDRFHEDPQKAVAPAPANASVDGVFELASQQVDELGNTISSSAAGGSCSSITYDAAYAQLPVMETVLAGAPSGGCGSVPITTTAAYDRGLVAVTTLLGAHGELSLASYDGFGRLVSLHKPDPDAPGLISPLPSLQVEYLATPDPVQQPYSLLHTLVQDGATPADASYRSTWAYVDGMGRTVITLEEADPGAGDGGAWIARGAVDYDDKGAVERAYLPWYHDGDPQAFDVTIPPPTASTRTRYDAFGRTVQSFNLDGAISAQVVHHALSTDFHDAADLALGGPHQGTPATVRKDGHGRTVSAIERIHVGAQIEQHETRAAYLPTGEVSSVTRVRVGSADPPVVRWMRHDSLGRMVLNVEPNATAGFTPDPSADPATFHALRYAYADSGDLVGTSDARGCGVNFHYDAAGRAVAEDYSPCLATHADYSAPDLASGVGAEVFYRYDTADPDSASIPGFTIPTSLLAGRLVSVVDRAEKHVLRYDGRGRATGVAKRVARPGPPGDDPASRYAPRWYVSTVAFDGADRQVTSSTGARAPELLGAGQESTVTAEYSRRGAIKRVAGSYGVLIASVQRDAVGLAQQIGYGDLAQTTTVTTLDARRRPATVQTFRAAPPAWSSPPADYLPSPSGASTLQLLLEDTEISYDEVDNPIAIHDWRNEAEWPSGAKPVQRSMQYDDLYRLTRVDATYTGGADWVSPFAAENGGVVDPMRARPSPHVSFARRVRSQSFAFDWLGNTVATDDDAQGFYDRSLGTVTNGTAASGPYRIQAAAGAPGGPRTGALTAAYDAAGNLVGLAVQRDGPCLPAGATCSQRFAYEWDEIGRLARARRWDVANPGPASAPPPAATADVDLRYAYDAANARVSKTATDGQGAERHTLHIFGSLELRRAQWIDDPSDPSASDYEDSAETEVPYLFANGLQLGRVVHDAGAPAWSGAAMHVLLQLPDHLGSNSIVIDKATGELVERTTYQAYGATDSDYRPGRWGAFRADHRFTGKEEDVEVGIVYFGARYYVPALGRWMSPDPLALHGLGADLNLYAYVHGQVFRAVDPVGLDKIYPLPPVMVESAKQDPSSKQWSIVMAPVFVSADGSLHVPEQAPPAPAAEAPEVSPDVTVCHGGCHGYDGKRDLGTGLIRYGNLGGAPTHGTPMDPAMPIKAVANGAVAALTGTVRILLPFSLGLPEFDRMEQRARPFQYRNRAEATFAVPFELVGQAVTGKVLPKLAALPKLRGKPAAGGLTLMEASDAFATNAARARPIPGFYDVVIHGDETRFYFTSDPMDPGIDHRALAKLIKADPNYRGGPIRLLSCNTGGHTGAAQNLANKLGVQVLAPDDLLWAHPSGTLTIGPDAATATGNWHIHFPNQQVP